MKRAHAVGKMAPIDLFSAGLQENFNLEKLHFICKAQSIAVTAGVPRSYQSGKSGHHFIFSLLSIMLTVCVLHMAFVMLRYIFSIYNF